ncbi:alpha/beta hydrolase [Niabella yanshanensis]|uniref:Alpha/beta hydrolase n=1 Tax=Niabella yanshanensis TaxID=577386 RepID=A0ABZ0W8D3_9BACT|nr:alpha/beta hydrolase [Niabella yanshanensis]WQD38789.1 alpha/beta hydrolase [Niabella yanshanensis]
MKIRFICNREKPVAWPLTTVLLLAVLLLSTGFCSCKSLKLRKSDEYHISANLKLGYPTQIKYFLVGKQKIRCLTTGNPDGKNLLLVHGSPSSLSSWMPLYADSAFMNAFKMIAVDRPGYGYSDFGKVETSIAKQAELVEAVMDSLKLSATILLGNSYGGPIAAQIAMRRPKKITHLVLLSASVKPTAEKTYGISHLMIAPVVKYLFPAIFRMSSEEKFSHAAELALLKNWDSIGSPTSIIHGDQDRLVYFSNAEFLKEKIPHSKLYVMEGKGHALMFTDPVYLKQILWNVLNIND